MDTKKLTNDEITEVETVLNKTANLITELGQVEYTILTHNARTQMLMEKKQKLSEEYQFVNELQKNLADKLEKKYGVGVLNPDTFEFNVNTDENSINNKTGEN